MTASSAHTKNQAAHNNKSNNNLEKKVNLTLAIKQNFEAKIHLHIHQSQASLSNLYLHLQSSQDRSHLCCPFSSLGLPFYFCLNFNIKSKYFDYRLEIVDI